MVVVFPGRHSLRSSDGFGTAAAPAYGQQGVRSQGFNVWFDATRAKADLDGLRDTKVSEITGASIDAVVKTTRDIKQRLRAYIDTHFTGSDFIGGKGGGKARRRVALAATQDKFYDDIEETGQYTGLIYSKFGRGSGPGSFVDYLLLHVRGGTIRPSGDWLRLDSGAAGGAFGQVGYYPMSDSRIFFRPSDDGKKLFLLRSFGRKGHGAKTKGKTVLLATLVKLVNVKPDLAGIDTIAAERPSLFIRYFDESLRRQQGAGA